MNEDRHFLPDPDGGDRYLLRREWAEAKGRIEDRFSDHKERIQRLESSCLDGSRKLEDNFRDRCGRIESQLAEDRRAHERLHDEVDSLSLLMRVRAGQLAIAASILLAVLSLVGPKVVEWLWPL